MESKPSPDGKRRELLPDTIAHQNRVWDLLDQLNNHATAFNEKWKLDARKEVEKGDTRPSEKEVFSTVDEIYKGFEKIEYRLEALIKTFGNIRTNYLGEP